jgi:hypothetical protein
MKWTNSTTCNIVKLLFYKALRRGMHLAMYFCEDGMPVFIVCGRGDQKLLPQCHLAGASDRHLAILRSP